MIQSPKRDLDLARLAREAQELGADELRVLAWIARRLRQGRHQYGPLSLSSDLRDWLRERDEELADALVYAACRALVRPAAPLSLRRVLVLAAVVCLSAAVPVALLLTR